MAAAHRLYLEEGFREYHYNDPVTESTLVFLQKPLD
jgi:hypothetical protein